MYSLIKKIKTDVLASSPKNKLLSYTNQYQKFFIILFITFVSYQCVSISYKLLGFSLINSTMPAMGILTPLDEDSAKKIAINQGPESYQAILDRNLFHTTDQTLADKENQLKGSNANIQSITALYLLKGTVAGGAKYGFAIIEDKTRQKQYIYKVGDRVQGAVLVKIQRDRVTFRTDGGEETLKRTDAIEAPILPDEPASASPLTTAVESRVVNVNRAEMHASLKDMGNMLSQVQLRPYFTAGKPDGFLLNNIEKGSVYQKLGLLNGDIIQGVNNRRMQSADDVVEFYNKLKSDTRMALQINRHGKAETIQYNFQ